MAGTLYLIPTPIGNLEDMTYRAVRLLHEVDKIAAEDTRHTRKLLTHFGIHTPLVSYHEHNKDVQGHILIEELLQGVDIACVTDAGMPGIADPGAILAKDAIERGIPVVPLPGANAALTALIASGLDTRQFAFVGFLPRTKDKARSVLEGVADHRETLLFYEAPHHLKKTLKLLLEILGDREAVLARELTKKYEEFLRGSLSHLLAGLDEREPRGEYVILTAGNLESEGSKTQPALQDADPLAMMDRLMSTGLDKKQAMKETAKAFGLSRRDVYQMRINI